MLKNNGYNVKVINLLEMDKLYNTNIHEKIAEQKKRLEQQ
jgi:hypothetical protein